MARRIGMDGKEKKSVGSKRGPPEFSLIIQNTINTKLNILRQYKSMLSHQFCWSNRLRSKNYFRLSLPLNNMIVAFLFTGAANIEQERTFM